MASWEPLFRSESQIHHLALGQRERLCHTDAGEGPSFKALATQQRAKKMGLGQRFQQRLTIWETFMGEVTLEADSEGWGSCE